MQQQRAPEQVAAVLMEEIRAGRVADGAPLAPERVLCARFGVSRPTIRAALHLLDARGFAALEPARRPRARKPSLSRVFDKAGEALAGVLGGAETTAHLEQIRQFVEVGAVRQAAREASNLDLTQIHRALEACYAALGDDAAFAGADAHFHRAIVAVTRNPLILEWHDRFVATLLATRPVAPEAERNRESYEEHRQIFEAIAAGDGARAMAAMERHLARAYRSRLPAPPRAEPVERT